MFSAIFLLFACVIGLVSVLGSIFWIWMIIDCATREPSATNDKIIWLLIIIFTHFIGALIYFLVRRPERIRLIGR